MDAATSLPAHCESYAFNRQVTDFNIIGHLLNSTFYHEIHSNGENRDTTSFHNNVLHNICTFRSFLWNSRYSHREGRCNNSNMITKCIMLSTFMKARSHLHIYIFRYEFYQHILLSCLTFV